MKKVFTLLLLTLFVVSVPVLSALVDVPSDHWAYDAIEKAVKSGILEGYPDGTYKGERNMTRYELAMVIARMLDQIDAIPQGGGGGDVTSGELEEVKEIIKKLTAEFKDELAALDVKIDENAKRITSVEKKVEGLRGLGLTLKMSGTLRQRVDVVDSDDDAGNALLNLYGLQIGGTEAGYEMFGYLAIEGKAGDNVDVLVELDAVKSNVVTGYGVAGDQNLDLELDQAFASIDFSESAKELDLLKVTMGSQYWKFGPYGMLADNGYAANPALRVDVAKDRISLTGIGAVLSVTPNVSGMGSSQGDALYAGRLGIDIAPVKLGVNFLGNGVGQETGWGIDIDTALLTESPYLTGLRAEYLQMTDDQTGTDLWGNPNANMDDYSFIVGLDAYKTDMTKITLLYADITAAPGLTGIELNPFTEYDLSGVDINNDNINDWVFKSYDSGTVVFPGDFEGFGVKASHTVLNDVTITAKGFYGDYQSGVDYPGFAALGVSKPITDDAIVSIEYAQQGRDPMVLNRIRGELLVNF
jgi:uncharacterized protein YqgV (UPF0045/DUF77 family)